MFEFSNEKTEAALESVCVHMRKMNGMHHILQTTTRASKQLLSKEFVFHDGKRLDSLSPAI